MSKEHRELLAPHEVIVVGKLRDKSDTTVIDVTLPFAEQLDAMMKKFKFIRSTLETGTATAKAAIAAGFLSGPFFHILVGDFGGATYKLPSGQVVKRSRALNDPGFAVIFKSNRETTFEEIKEELLSKRVEFVGGDPNNGQLRLKEYALIGLWDIFPLGFHHYVWQRDPETGILKEFFANRKQDNGTYKKEQAIRNTGQHFVFESEIDNLEGLRDQLREQVIRWKVPAPVDNSNPEKGVIDTTGKPTPTVEPAAKKVGDDL